MTAFPRIYINKFKKNYLQQLIGQKNKNKSNFKILSKIIFFEEQILRNE